MAKKNSTALLITGLTLLLLVFTITQPPQIVKALSVFLVMGGASAFVYFSKNLNKYAVPIDTKPQKAIPAILFGIVLGIAFFVINKFVPGASIGLPLLPNSITSTLQYLVVGWFAPIFEETFFRGALLAYFLLLFGPKKKGRAIVLQALAFALAHVSAYVTGIYEYPSIVAGVSALTANIGAFVVAFVFGIVAGWAVLRGTSGKISKGNLLASMTFHSLVNHIIYLALAVVIIN